MSPARRPGSPRGGSGEPRDTEGEVTRALAAHVAGVEPDPAAWARIEDRLDRGEVRRLGGAARFGPPRRPTLVAAVFVLVLVVAAAAVVRGRATDGSLEVATAPAAGAELAIVALTDDGRIVELGLDGTERREIYAPAADGSEGRLTGGLSVSSVDRTIYVERIGSAPCGLPYGVDVIGEIVAVPFAGGYPRIVVPVGRNPEVEPGSGLVAYATPTDGSTCSTSSANAWSSAILDPATGRTSTVNPVLRLDGTEVLASLSPNVYDLEPVWGGSDRALYLLGDGGSGIPFRSLYRQAIDPSANPMLAEDVLVVEGGESPSDPNGPFGSMSSVVAVGGATIHVEPGSADHLVMALADVDAPATVTLAEITVGEDGRLTRGDDAPVVIDLSATGLSSFGVTGVELDAESGRALITTVERWGADARAPEERLGADVPATAAVGDQRSPLLLWDGTSVRLLATGVTSATWVRTGPDPAPTATPAATVAPESPAGTVEPADATDAGIVVGAGRGAPRPDDASAILASFSAFFEHGDKAFLEGSVALEPAMAAGAETVPDGGVGVTLTVTAIRFTGPDTAEVDFQLDKDGNFFTAPATGTAVRAEGRWLVSAATMCTLVSRVGIACPPIG